MAILIHPATLSRFSTLVSCLATENILNKVAAVYVFLFLRCLTNVHLCLSEYRTKQCNIHCHRKSNTPIS